MHPNQKQEGLKTFPLLLYPLTRGDSQRRQNRRYNRQYLQRPLKYFLPDERGHNHLSALGASLMPLFRPYTAPQGLSVINQAFHYEKLPLCLRLTRASTTLSRFHTFTFLFPVFTSPLKRAINLYYIYIIL